MVAARPRRAHPSLEALEDRALLSATLVQDIDRTTAGAITPLMPTAQFAAVGETVYFAASDGIHGTELWKSDGTAVGTKLVKDVRPGLDGSNPYSLVAVGGTVYFTADDGVHGPELWASDGTDAGTRLVKDVTPGGASMPFSTGEGPANLTGVGGTLFFTAANATGFDLWKSDGTTAGTVRLQTFTRPGSEYWHTVTLTALGNAVYFSASDGVHGTELWKSDGTAAGTVALGDLNPGSGSSLPSEITAVGGRLYFSADDGVHGAELWTSDGTASGTRMIQDINLAANSPYGGPSSSYPSSFTAVGNTVYFGADDGVHGKELWKTDGTEQGTVLVDDIGAGESPWGLDGEMRPNGSYPAELTAFRGRLYFRADDGEHGAELWTSDGTDGGTRMVADLNTATDLPWAPGQVGSSFPFGLLVSGDRLLFNATDADGAGLWTTDGTKPPVLLGRLGGPGGNGVTALTAVGDRIYFIGSDRDHGTELWRTDGTAGGTALVVDINRTTADATPREVTQSGGKTYFVANDGVNGHDLWRTDGTTAGTRPVRDITRGKPWTFVHNLTDVNGTLFFAASESSIPTDQLWKTDGTAAGTVRLSEVTPGEMVSFRNRLFFAGTSLGFISGLWTSDGTAAGTISLAEVSQVRDLTVVGNTLYFTGDDFVHGRALWKTDGTAAGTAMVADLNPSTTDYGPGRLTAVGNRLYFAADDGTHGTELWVSDGTEAGTRLVKDVNPGEQPALTTLILPYTTELIDGGGVVYFNADDGTHGPELWRSDGTDAGTRMVKDINPTAVSYFGENPSNIRGLTRVGGTVYFAADDGVHGQELWKTDGTAAGTKMVKDILPGTPSAGPYSPTLWIGSSPANLVAVGGRLYFTASDASHGAELWQTDGTASGTKIVQDVYPGGGAGAVVDMWQQRTVWNAGGVLYFAAVDPGHGQELWRLTTSSPPASNRAPSASAGGPYSVREGQSLTLDASRSTDPDRDNLSYTWDINGDGVYGDAVGVKPTVSATRLQQLGLRGGPTSTRVRVRVDDGHGHTVTADARLTVVDAPLSVRAVETKAVEAAEFRGVVATFTDPGGPERVANYAATIDWGDGRVEAGAVKLVGSRFEVSGRHTYSRRGDYRVRVTVRDQGGSPAMTTGTLRVADAPLIASAMPFRPTEGVPFSGVVARFRDGNPDGLLAELRATIDWGDGKKTNAVLTRSSRGLFEVRGTHTYARPGTYTVLVQVLSSGGSTAKVSFGVSVGKRRSGA